MSHTGFKSMNDVSDNLNNLKIISSEIEKPSLCCSPVLFVVSPYILGGSVWLHPILVIILVLLGASVGGILGMLFAVPIAAIIKVIIGELVTSIKK